MQIDPKSVIKFYHPL